MQKAISHLAYEPFTSFVEAGLHKYANSKSIAAALRLAESVLNYTPSRGWTWQHTVAARMERARLAGVTPKSILQQVAEHFALVEQTPQLFRSARCEQFALARHVLRCCPGPIGRPGARFLLGFGGLVVEELGAFGIQFIRRLHQDLAERHALRRSAADFTEKTE